jgi:hypothetical protein
MGVESLLVLVLDQATGGFEICPDHLLDERVKVDPSLPAEYAFGFSRVTEEKAGFFLGGSGKKDGHHLLKEQEKHVLDFCGTEVARIDFDDGLAGFDVDGFLVYASSLPPIMIYASTVNEWLFGGRDGCIPQFNTKLAKRLLDELPDGVGLPSRENKVLRDGLLEHEPHAFHIITGCKRHQAPNPMSEKARRINRQHAPCPQSRFASRFPR